ADEALTARVRAADRAAKLARLRAGPTEVLELPATTPQHAIAARRAIRGVVGPSDDARMVIHIHVDGRRVSTEETGGELPLIAMVDVGDGALDDELTGLTTEARAELIQEVRAVAPALIGAMLVREPRAV